MSKAPRYPDSDEFQTSSESYIACPWCGEKWEDDLHGWGDRGEEVCECCGRTFSFVAEYEVTYSTEKVE
jgi:uncharacterized Zn-finger protein